MSAGPSANHGPQVNAGKAHTHNKFYVSNQPEGKHSSRIPIASHSKDIAIKMICPYFLFSDCCKCNMSVWKAADVLKECTEANKSNMFLVAIKVRQRLLESGMLAEDISLTDPPFLFLIIKHYLANTTFCSAVRRVWVNCIFKKLLLHPSSFKSCFVTPIPVIPKAWKYIHFPNEITVCLSTPVQYLLTSNK